jgi:hypothetical protein
MKIAHRKGLHKKKARLRALNKDKLIALGVLKAPAKKAPASKK